MKTNQILTTRVSNLNHLMKVAILGVVLAICMPATAFAEGSQIAARPLSPQEIKDHNLPAGVQKSGGLHNIGIGEPFYLEAQVPAGTTVVTTEWSLESKPADSAAELSESPLPLTIPVYNPGDREVNFVAGRKLLVPDIVGKYQVKAVVKTDGEDIVITRDLYGATYIGAGDGFVFSDPLRCSVCHTEKYNGWKETRHADAFTNHIEGRGSNHYGEHCNACHTLGYNTAPEADNGGFDDIAKLVEWAFPETLEPGNFDAMPKDLQHKANIQCESCHGAGSAHVAAGGNPEMITMSTSSGDCAQCHDSAPYHVINKQWNSSNHAVATRYPTGEGRSSCVGCHSGVGFIDRTDGLPQNERRTEWEAIVCATCHDPHAGDNPHQLRKVDSVTFVNGHTETQGGNGLLCMNCHMSRRDAETYVTEYHGHYGPHYGPQGDMLAGTNAIEYGQRIPSSAHLAAVKDSCVTCHMQDTSRDNPAHTLAGGHTFKPSWNGGTPEDHSDDIPLVEACSNCHGGIESFDFPRQDFDGDGVIAGVQTEVKGLMSKLALLLPPYGVDEVSVTADYTPAELRAAYNYLFVEDDGSFGVHNLSYTLGILRGAIADVSGTSLDSDGDGILDEWEVEHFGSIVAKSGDGDADMDGLSDRLEYQVGSNPNLADSDGDGFGDLAELHAGTDIQNAEDNPVTGRSEIHHAVEYVFYTEAGKSYQVQVADSLNGTGWVDVGEPIEGNGDVIQHFASTREEAQQYFRVIELQ
jgi:hypothetical protein